MLEGFGPFQGVDSLSCQHSEADLRAPLLDLAFLPEITGPLKVLAGLRDVIPKIERISNSLVL